MKNVPEDGPQKLGLRVIGLAQQFKALANRLFEDPFDHGLDRAGRRNIGVRRGIEHQDVPPDLLVEARAGLLAHPPGGDQFFDHRRNGVKRGKRIVLQPVFHRADHVRERIQPHDVAGAEGRRLCAPEFAAGECVDGVVAKAVFLRLGKHSKNREHANAVCDKIRCVPGAHDALAHRGGHERFETVDDGGIGGNRWDLFKQVHVTRRIKEVHAAEPLLEGIRKPLRQFGNRQARRVGREYRVWRDMRGHPGIERVLPVQAFGDRLDDQVALGEPREIVLVIGAFDQVRCRRNAQRCRLELAQRFDRFQGNGVLVDLLALLCGGGQIEQDDRYAGVDAMGCDLGAHDASAQYGHFTDRLIG